MSDADVRPNYRARPDSRIPRPAASRLALSAMMVVLLAISGFAIWASRTTQQSLTQISRLTSLTHASDSAALSFESEEFLVHQYLMKPSPELKTAASARSADVVSYLQRFKKDGDALDAVLVDDLLRLHQTYVGGTVGTMAAVDRGDLVTAAAINSSIDPQFGAVQSKLAAASDHELAETNRAFASLHQQQDFLVTVTAPTFGIGMLILLLLALIVLAYQRSAEKRAAEETLQLMHDALTGLPNRPLFRDRGDLALAAAARNRLSGAVMLLDLDRFKEVNDILGHDQGDAVLREVASRLKATLRNADTVGRLGGDEFTILLPRVADRASAMAVASKVAHALQESFHVGGVTLNLEASIGVAIFPEQGEDIDTLIGRADIAMFVSKRDHVSCTAYAPELDASAPRAAALGGTWARYAPERPSAAARNLEGPPAHLSESFEALGPGSLHYLLR